MSMNSSRNLDVATAGPIWGIACLLGHCGWIRAVAVDNTAKWTDTVAFITGVLLRVIFCESRGECGAETAKFPRQPRI